MGKERTLREWETLFESADLKLQRMSPIQDNFGTSILEAVKR